MALGVEESAVEVSKRMRLPRSFFQIAGVAVAWGLLFIIFALKVEHFADSPEAFSDTIWSIILQCSVTTLLAVGMTYVIITAGIDLSVGTVMALASVLMGKVLVRGDGALWVIAGIGTALLVGTTVGLLNGVLIAFGRVPPFICTLAMYIAASGLALIVTRSQTLAGLPDSFTWLGGTFLKGIPIPAAFALLAVFGGQIVLSFTRFGRYLFAVGGNPEAAYLSGVPVRRCLVLTYGFCGFMVGVAAVVSTARMQAASPIFGQGQELNAIAAAILGGTSLMGGEGTVVGTLFGALVIQTLRAGLTRMQVDANWQQVLIGGILVAMVLLDQFRLRRLQKS